MAPTSSKGESDAQVGGGLQDDTGEEDANEDNTTTAADLAAAKAKLYRLKRKTVNGRLYGLAIDGLQTRVVELEKEVETRSKVSVRDYNRLVDHKLLFQEELRLLREEMAKLYLSIAARPAEQAELAHVRSEFAEQTRVVQHQMDTSAAVRRLEADRDLLRAELTSPGSGALLARNAALTRELETAEAKHLAEHQQLSVDVITMLVEVLDEQASRVTTIKPRPVLLQVAEMEDEGAQVVNKATEWDRRDKSHAFAVSSE
ncbi:MAG: hypothetical protein M1826_002841 [Phylliscum demangeonii]|nr:MAG: hypothetical protein M1826_002841 [Phylliscum demangeonii]